MLCQWVKRKVLSRRNKQLRFLLNRLIKFPCAVSATLTRPWSETAVANASISRGYESRAREWAWNESPSRERERGFARFSCSSSAVSVSMRSRNSFLRSASLARSRHSLKQVALRLVKVRHRFRPALSPDPPPSGPLTSPFHFPHSTPPTPARPSNAATVAAATASIAGSSWFVSPLAPRTTPPSRRSNNLRPALPHPQCKRAASLPKAT